MDLEVRVIADPTPRSSGHTSFLEVPASDRKSTEPTDRA
jgi:hypothetical protein